MATNSEVLSQDHVTLSRDLGFFDIAMIGVGAMIGAGIFVLTGIAAGEAGPALILAFLLNGIVTTFTAMAYAELGSAFPEAGGGYLWVKEGLGGMNGFLSGWMSWFAHAVAGSLYGLGFGHFALELWELAGIPTLGISHDIWPLAFCTLIIALFSYINFRGASETGTVGNVITIAKVIILGFFVIAGLVAMSRSGDWSERYTDNFFPEGISGVVIAMGLTFIAFEGYEIIAQSGEEVIDPMKNVPRAIFTSIFVVVIIYIAVAFVAIGAIDPPNGMLPHEFLGLNGETAVVEAAGQFMPAGKILLLISGLASTMSALNATTYSSSRVSFAMGRDHNLPAMFSRIHPRTKTPHIAVMFSGIFMVLMAWSLPIESVAAAADIMFLLLFLQVNVAVMTLRQKMPDLERGFVIPWFPVVPIIGFVTNLALAIYLYTYEPIAWYVGGMWLIVGILAYYMIFSRIEELEKPKEIVHEEVLVSRKFSVLVPVAEERQAQILGKIGSMIANSNQGEVMALYVQNVPQTLTLDQGRSLIQEQRKNLLEKVIEVSKERNVPVHTMIRLGRNIAESVRKTAVENASDMIVIGWPGTSHKAAERAFRFSSVIDPIVDNPPTDVAIVRYHESDPSLDDIKSILVAIAGGPNSRRSIEVAITLASQINGDKPKPKVVMYTAMPFDAPENIKVRLQKDFDRFAAEFASYPNLETKIVNAYNSSSEAIARHILDEAGNHDLVVIGAKKETLFENVLIGGISETVAEEANVPVIMVKRRSSPVHNWLRQTVLEPTTGSSVKRNLKNDETNGDQDAAEPAQEA